MADSGARSRVVVIVVFDGVKLLDAAGAAEVFAEANRFGADYRLKIASVNGRDVTTSIGTSLAVTDRISAIDFADTVMVAGGDNLVGRAIDPELVEALRSVPARTRRLASIRTGSFILAQPGLLTGRRATTHWRHTLATRARQMRCARRDLRPRRRCVHLGGRVVGHRPGAGIGGTGLRRRARPRCRAVVGGASQTGGEIRTSYGMDALVEADLVVVPGTHQFLEEPDPQAVSALKAAADNGAQIAGRTHSGIDGRRGDSII